MQTPPHACVPTPLCPWSQGCRGGDLPRPPWPAAPGGHLVREQSAPWLHLPASAGGTHNSPQGPEGIPGAKLPVISIQDALQVDCKEKHSLSQTHANILHTNPSKPAPGEGSWAAQERSLVRTALAAPWARPPAPPGGDESREAPPAAAVPPGTRPPRWLGGVFSRLIEPCPQFHPLREKALDHPRMKTGL